MPTAAKLVAAIAFGFVAWVAAGLVVPYLPDGKNPGNLAWLAIAAGVVMGWIVSGRHAGQGMRAGAGYGLTTIAATVFWCLLIVAGIEMYDRSISLRYADPLDALVDVVRLFLEHARLLAHLDVIVWLVVGALFGGWVTERTARNWS